MSTDDERQMHEAMRDELEAEMARLHSELDYVNRHLEAESEFSPEEISGDINEDIKVSVLIVFADGHYQLEWFCPINTAMVMMAAAIEDIADNADQFAEQSRTLGYES